MLQPGAAANSNRLVNLEVGVTGMPEVGRDVRLDLKSRLPASLMNRVLSRRRHWGRREAEPTAVKRKQYPE